MGKLRRMVDKVKGLCYQILAIFLPAPLWQRLIRRRFKDLLQAVQDDLTDRFLEVLLHGMKLGFLLLPGYRRNLYGWSGTLVFCTREKRISATTHFYEGFMTVDETASSKANAFVVFKDGAALQSFLLAEDQDIFHSLLANSVAVEGNLNYVCKFGFMAKDLLYRLGVSV